MVVIILDVAQLMPVHRQLMVDVTITHVKIRHVVRILHVVLLAVVQLNRQMFVNPISNNILLVLEFSIL
jgi:hypothetical protein